ncbi:alpha/beta hydrolase [Roseomonas sp. 18066]|uniref:alpha/beta hydrolase n=1 Tax=Roseomonas sp. 18066 TaxID=2681412 RepID=UPI00135991CF|nr:dienelactone hydrolase family protein [Roseomonas sp. 18066]
MTANPHAGRPLARAGVAAGEAQRALILLHGRGGDAADMLGLGGHLGVPGYALLAPQAAGNTWYPHRFIEPTTRNEPWLSGALAAVDAAVTATGLPDDKIALLGFSQGACLALEYAWRSGRRFGAVIGLSGGLIGDQLAAVTPGARFDGVPVLLGCSKQDGHIPLSRVLETEERFKAQGASVTTRLYEGGYHGVTEDEVTLARELLAKI